MSCFKPFPYEINGKTYAFPCGYCLNCRVDKRNTLSDRCKYELKQKMTGAFVTFTYDDYHLSDNYVKQYDGSILANLNYNDAVKFIQRLRKYIKYHTEVNNILCQPDFTYLFVGEYGKNGELFDRPHFHVLFFGLDFAYCKKMFFEEWKNGFIDSLPILDGGINYVLKYMDKQLHGEQAFYEYDVKLLNRPKIHMSKGLGSGLFLDKEKQQDIIENNYTYSCGRGLRRPLPSYYKNLYTDSKRTVDDRKTIEKMKNYNLRDFSTHSIFDFKKQQAILKERKLQLMLHNSLVPVLDYITEYFSSFKVRKKTLPILVSRALAQDYIDSIPF